MKLQLKSTVEFCSVAFAAFCGFLLAWFVWGQSASSELLLLERSKQFQELPSEQQDQLRRAYSAYSSAMEPVGSGPEAIAQADRRRSDLDQLHRAVSTEPELKSRLEQFNQWWTAVSSAERGSLQEMIRNGNAEAISSRIFDDQQQSRYLLVDFSLGPYRFSRHFNGPRLRTEDYSEYRWLPNLKLKPEEYARILDQAFPVNSLSSEHQRELRALTDPEHQLLYRTLRSLEGIRDGGGPAAYDNLSGLMKALISVVSEFYSEWSELFSARIEDSRNPRAFFSRIGVIIACVSVLDQAVVELGEDLRNNFVADDHELMAAFESASDEVRRGLLTMSPEVARERLQKIAVLDLNESDSAERRLYRQLLAYDESLIAFQRLFSSRFPGQIPGINPPTGGGPSPRNGQPPPSPPRGGAGKADRNK